MRKVTILIFSVTLLFMSITSFACLVTPDFLFVDDIETAIISQIGQAEKTVDIAMHGFTDRDLADAVIEAHKRGVAVRIYLDKEQKEAKSSKSRYLINNGISVRYSNNSYIRDHEFCVIDNRIAITDSYDWIVSVEERDNKSLIIIEYCYVTIEHMREFDRLWTEHYIIEEVAEEQQEISGISFEEVKPEKEQASYDPIVYITKTGRKYHSAGCRYLKSSSIPIKLSEAKAEGYTPCSVCKPPG